jgi:nucleoside-diphosphate-sugar epimerase
MNSLSVNAIRAINSEEELEEVLSRPNAADVEFMKQLSGNLLILGAGGKMGPSLALRAKRAAGLSGVERRILAVSRFSSGSTREMLGRSGVETLCCDLMDPEQVRELPSCQNVIFMAGRKFGTHERFDLTWASNTLVPAHVASTFRDSRLMVFSTGNIYPLVPVAGTGSVETDPPAPVGEYAQSCLGRERVIEFFSRQNGTACLLFRLNYAVDLRYGVLVDIAWKVFKEEPIDLTVAYFNVIWQGDANSFALRSLRLCQSPPCILNGTGLEKISVKETAQFFARRWGRSLHFKGEEGPVALLSNASLCRTLLGEPDVNLELLREWVAHWVEMGGASLGKPTKFEVSNGNY